ncbi:MAG: NifU family protein [Planctomycetota bacterium]
MSETQDKSLLDQVQAVIDEIRPYLQGDGGDCELMGVEDDGTVQLKFVGACGGCPSSTATLKMGIENALKERVPEIREVIQVF